MQGTCPGPGAAHLRHPPCRLCVGASSASFPARARTAAGERGTLPAASATEPSPPASGLCLPRASWPRLARARLGNGLPCQAGPLQPGPGAAPGPLLTPTLTAWARLSTSTDSYLGLGHGPREAVDKRHQQHPQESGEGDGGRCAGEPAYSPRRGRHACSVPERAKESSRRSSRNQRTQSARSSFPAQEPLSSPGSSQAKCRPASLSPPYIFGPPL